MNPYFVYVVSDSVGETAEFVAKAAISQFEASSLEMKRFHRVDTNAKIDEVLSGIEPATAVLFYTLADPQLKTFLETEAGKRGIPTVDILTPCVETIANRFGLQSNDEVGTLRKLDENYFDRVAAVEFAVQYDDGKDPSGFAKADLVILGVSRTSKTPLSMYLANKNLRVANLPLAPEIPVPDIIYQLPRKKLVGLMIRPQNLNEIRTERLKIMGAAACGTNYADPNRLLEELDYAKKLYRRLGCRVLDVTNRAVEETAGNILEIYKEALHE